MHSDADLTRCLRRRNRGDQIMTEMTLQQSLNTLKFKELARLHKILGGGFDFFRGPENGAAWGKEIAINWLIANRDHDEIRAAIPQSIEQTPAKPEPITPTETISMTNPDVASQIGAAVAGIIGNMSVNPEQVRGIVREELARTEPTKVEYHIRRIDGETVKVKGYVRPEMPKVLTRISAGVNILLVGPAGCGKTHLAEQVAESLGRPFAAVSCTAGMSESAFKGRLLPVENGNFRYVESDFVRLYRNGGVFLIDEADALDGNVALTLNNALANSKGFTNDLILNGDTFVQRHPDFVCIAAANTFGTGANATYAGREKLDEAFLDRFRAGRMFMDYDREFERQAVDGRLLKWGWDVRKKINDNRIQKVLSTRFLIDSTKLILAGLPHGEVVDAFFADWKSDDRLRVDVAV